MAAKKEVKQEYDVAFAMKGLESTLQSLRDTMQNGFRNMERGTARKMPEPMSRQAKQRIWTTAFLIGVATLSRYAAVNVGDGTHFADYWLGALAVTTLVGGIVLGIALIIDLVD